MCSGTPRFSYGGPKLTICTCAAGSCSVMSRGCRWVRARVWYQGGYSGWVAGGLYRGTTQPPRKEGPDQRSGPRSPCRGRSGWVWGRVRVPVRPGSRTHPAGPLPSGRWFWTLPRANAASWPIGTRFDLISHKLSQNHEVSPKYVNKASLSPYFQNGLQKSALGFLGFPFPLAFSHKELMGVFWPYPRV